jgi:hypothetical protein
VHPATRHPDHFESIERLESLKVTVLRPSADAYEADANLVET